MTHSKMPHKSVKLTTIVSGQFSNYTLKTKFIDYIISHITVSFDKFIDFHKGLQINRIPAYLSIHIFYVIGTIYECSLNYIIEMHFFLN